MAEGFSQNPKLPSGIKTIMGHLEQPEPELPLGRPEPEIRKRWISLTHRLLFIGFVVYLVYQMPVWSHSSLTDRHGIGKVTKVVSGGPLDTFNWTKLVPSTDLTWVACYDEFECARLSVPLDYSKPSGEKAAVALARLPAKVKSSDSAYRGPILFNPGGPGGSGVLTILGLAKAFHNILGEDFDLVGFDPRGVGFTTPVVSAFTTDLERILWSSDAVMDANRTSDALGRQYTKAEIQGKLAEERTKHSAEHVGTPTVARDMLSIVKAHGREKLNYWGFSYGTVLGATFAAMFPDNVERLIIDGVVDSDNYYASLWDNNLRDADAAFNSLLQACADAGPLECPLHENSTELIAARIDRLMERLDEKPSPFYDAANDLYGMYDSNLIKLLTFSILYNVHAAGKFYFDSLSVIERRVNITDPTTIRVPTLSSFLKCDCPTTSRQQFGGGFEVTLAIACGDGDAVYSDVDEIRQHYEWMAGKFSKSFAYLWSMNAQCSGWKIQSKERFKGPFTANTSHPLLIIGNTADPVTPLWNAHKMSRGFNGSVVLTQNSPGHCSVSATSLCTMKYVQQYFRNGTLPKPGTVCEVESSVFGHGLNVDVEALSLEDQRLLQATNDLQQASFVPRLGIF